MNPSSSATMPFVFAENSDLTEDLIAVRYAESSDESTMVPAPVRLPALAPHAGALAIRRPASEAPAALTPVITFEEPDEVLRIEDLSVDPHVAALGSEGSPALESYRALSVKLLNLAARRKVKTLLVTSAQSGDGKTTIATGAAWSLAKGAERRVLLIDANSTPSSVARMLGIEPKLGWLNLLDGSAELEQTLSRLEPNGLYLLTAGSPAATPFTESSSSRLPDLIAELLAPRFDLVIVDSGSLPESPEAQHLATVLDGSLIVARANHTHHSKVTAARKLIPKERRLGVVLNELGLDVEIPSRRIGGRGLLGRLFGGRGGSRSPR